MGSLRLRKLQWILESGPIKDVMRVSIFSERGILASLLQLIHVRAAAGRWNVIIDRAMKRIVPRDVEIDEAVAAG